MMQPQGLAALMPQGQPAPQMNNPRLAAAMDVVTSDAEENILDPRTLAMLKYKDAIQAMQAADQMMAAAQPQPMPPTVAERTRLAAEQGIAGLAARLSPGVQQRGAQIAAQQGAGGLPQLAAPNMARMAGGGIVAFQKGGGPLPTAGGREEDYVVTTDELGNPIYASDIARELAAGITDTSEEGAARRAAYAALQTDRPNLREIARTPERPLSSEERVPTAGYGMGDRTGQADTLSGMASGVADSIRSGLGSLAPRDAERVDSDAGASSSSGRIGRASVASAQGRDPRERVDVMGILKEMFGSQRSPVNRRGRPTGVPTASGTTTPADTTAPVAAPVEVAATPTPSTPAATAPTPAARRPVERISEEEALAAISPSGPKDAFEYLMAYGQAPERAAKTAAAVSEPSGDRLSRVIAGLRGLGAQGLGGYAAGSAEETARMEEEAIAERERAREGKFRDREILQADREMNLMDALRRDQLEADVRDRQEAHQLRMAQLEAGKQEFLQEQIAKNTESVRGMINMLEASIMMGDDSSDKQNQLLALRDQELRIIEETEASLAGYMTPAEGQNASTLNANDFTVRQVTQ